MQGGRRIGVREGNVRMEVEVVTTRFPEGVIRQGMKTASQRWKRQEMNSALELPEEMPSGL